MISGIRGKVIDLLPGEVQIETPAGVVYELLVPVSDFPIIQAKSENIFLYSLLKISDDKAILYGFLNKKKKELFKSLISISGVGGKTALSFLSAFEVDELNLAIDQSDTSKLSSIPGVGKKTAQLIVLKLTGKLKLEEDDKDISTFQLKDDLISAMENLGYPKKMVAKLVNEVVENENQFDNFEEPFKIILSKVVKKN